MRWVVLEQDANIMDLIDNEYVNGSRLVHSTFCRDKSSMEALEFLEQMFQNGTFDQSKPEARALYQQGQASVIYEIKDMIRKVEKGFYEMATE